MQPPGMTEEALDNIVIKEYTTVRARLCEGHPRLATHFAVPPARRGCACRHLRSVPCRHGAGRPIPRHPMSAQVPRRSAPRGVVCGAVLRSRAPLPADCLDTWLQRSVQCPMCKADLRDGEGGTATGADAAAAAAEEPAPAPPAVTPDTMPLAADASSPPLYGAGAGAGSSNGRASSESRQSWNETNVLPNRNLSPRSPGGRACACKACVQQNSPSLYPHSELHGACLARVPRPHRH